MSKVANLPATMSAAEAFSEKDNNSNFDEKHVYMLAGKGIKPLRKREVETDDPEPMEWQFMEDAMATEPTGSQQVFTRGHFKAWTYWDLTKTHPEQASALQKAKKIDAEMKQYLQWV